MYSNLGKIFWKLFLLFIAVIALNGCRMNRQHEQAGLQIFKQPSVRLKILAKEQNRIVFEWRIVNSLPSSIWIPDESPAGKAFTSAPRAFMLPHDTILFAAAIPRSSDEQYNAEFIEGTSMPKYHFVELAPGDQVTRNYSVALPFEFPTDEQLRSIFQYRGIYKHTYSVFSPEIEEVEVVMKIASQAILAVEYWDVDPLGDSWLPVQQEAYDRLYNRSLVYQALLAKKYPADDFAVNPLLVRHIVYTSAITCNIPLREPIKIYFDQPVQVND